MVFIRSVLGWGLFLCGYHSVLGRVLFLCGIHSVLGWGLFLSGIHSVLARADFPLVITLSVLWRGDFSVVVTRSVLAGVRGGGVIVNMVLNVHRKHKAD